MFQRTFKKTSTLAKQEAQISQDAVIAENFEKDDFYEKPWFFNNYKYCFEIFLDDREAENSW